MEKEHSFSHNLLSKRFAMTRSVARRADNPSSTPLPERWRTVHRTQLQQRACQACCARLFPECTSLVHACLKNLRQSQLRNTATTVVGTASGTRTAI